MKHLRFEENILVDEAYTNYGKVDKNADEKKGYGIAKNFAETLEYGERKKWYQQLPEEPATVTKTVTAVISEEMRKEANSALHGDTAAYETKSNKNTSSDHQWAKTLLNKGTIGDRVAAATILIQDNPLYNLTALRNLVGGVKPAKKKDGIVIIDALSELLISEILIPDMKLRNFEQHPLGHVEEMTSGNKQARRNLLKLWFFEDQMKELYGTYIEALNKFAHDSVESNREKAVSAMSYLLMHHPEREKMLLTNIINKLGDPSQAVASKVIYHLCQLLYNHPNMKRVVLIEIEKMLFRSNISPRAQYYGICFLNQFYLGKDDSKIAEDLIRIYFSFFKASIKKGDIDSRVMSAILTGVKRAYPFANRERVSESALHVQAVHRLVHLAPPAVATHALALLHLLSDASSESADRYYNSLYRKLSNAEIFNTSQSALLFSLVYKSLKQDSNIERVTAFVKRLLQLCCYVSPAHACGILFLVSQVLKDGSKKEAVKLFWTKRDVKEETKEEKPVDVSQDEDDTSNKEAATEATTEDVPEEKEKKIDLLKGDKKDLLIDDEEESYVDLKIDSEGNIKPKKRHTSAVNGWYHAKVKAEGADHEVPEDKKLETEIRLKKTINMDRVISEYNPMARNPQYAGAAFSAYVELLTLAAHFHPSVKLFADKLINEQIIQYSGDPLKDFSAIRFLDRFVFKNPKSRREPHDVEGQAKKVRGSHPRFAVRRNYTAKGIRSIPVNSSTYLNEDVKKIPVDEKFLYDFLQKRRQNAESDEDSDNDSVTSEDFNSYLDKITGTKAQESDEELDFLADVEATKQSKPKKKADDASDNEDDELDDGDHDVDDEGDSDGDLNMSGDDEEPQLSDDEDELQLENSDEDDFIDVPGKKSKRSNKLKLKGSDDLGSLFASAEEFSTILEETATNKKQGSSQAVSNTDNASVKQLAWEEKRDSWIKGYNRSIHGGKKGGKKRHFDKTGKKGGKRKGGHVDGAGGKKRK
ncbi:unnamed protein product [Leptidea sinapis]|uniref:CCAAT-binding factor domain-containing protein n=1 Tax=Leptidea sinapis TaxID=189913 RepID=A0A5E4Q8B4_9NEOP|nr:unnamed protein product [Leptidea sinapis]